ncbi:hypothetical protein ACQPZP_41145 [Spirillospora sp. CA-142024]|uniref:hypothetical protein n=1 Tax=Spirillospora sp. CA-142024 TaxID=3240036 RepID=UPI003D8C413B
MVREHFNIDWCFGFRDWMRRIVEEDRRADLYRWPIQSFDGKVYRASDSVRLFVLRDKGSADVISSVNGVNLLSLPENVQPIDEVSLESDAILNLLDSLYRDFELRQQDCLFFLPEVEGRNIEEDWGLLPSQVQAILRLQVDYAIRWQSHYVRGFDTMGNFSLPPGYDFLAKECERFFKDHPRYERNVFLMTRFDAGSKFLVTLDQEIRKALREHGYNPVRADDKVYMPDRNLWNNVCVYMLCCSRGVAILEDRAANEFNPNVALEYGFMRALNKPALLLADNAFSNLRADILGTLRETFDLTDIEATVPVAIERWLRD